MQGLGDLVGAVSWFAVLAPGVAVVTFAISRRRHHDRPQAARHLAIALDVAVALSFLGILTVTLFPTDPYETGIERGLQLRPLASILDVARTAVDASVVLRIVGFNVLLFVPLGLALGMRVRRWWTVVGVAVATSVAIESLQAVLPLGRTTNVDDIILNTSGAVLGLGMAVAVRRGPHRQERRRDGDLSGSGSATHGRPRSG